MAKKTYCDKCGNEAENGIQAVLRRDSDFITSNGTFSGTTSNFSILMDLCKSCDKDFWKVIRTYFNIRA